MTRMHLFRHGQTIWNQLEIMQGHQDSPLSDTGRRQALVAARHIGNEDIYAAYSSSSSRAIETTRLLLGEKAVAIETLDELREINLGEWEGKQKAKVMEDYPDQYRDFWERPNSYRSVGGETFQPLWDRTVQAIKDILRSNQGKTVLVVSHAASVKAITSYFSGRSIHQIWDAPFAENLAHSIIESNHSNKYKLVKFCDHNWSED